MSLSHYTQHFFDENAEALSLSYPGIKLLRIKQELESFLSLKGMSSLDNQVYDDSSDEINLFFKKVKHS